MCSTDFRFFSSEYLQKAPLKEMAKLYMDYLKLLVALGREIAVCSSQGANKASKVQDSFYMDSLFKVMVCNLSLRLEDAVFSNWLDYSDGCISQLVLDQRFKVLASFRDRIRMPGLPQYGRLDPIYPDLEEYPEDHSQGFSDYELLEKIKTNSLALIMVIVRAEPTLVLSKHLFPAVFPENLLKLNFGTMFGSEHFFPANIYCREMSDTLNRVYGSSGIMIHFASYVSIAKFRSRSAKESLRKWNNELASCLAEPVPQNSGWSTQMSLIGFFMTETNYKVKGNIINTIGVIHHQVYGICDIQDKCAPGSKYLISSFVNISREKLETFAVGFLMAYFLDLYTCPITNMRHIFEGIHQCPIQSMLVHIPNKFVERVIHFLVVPVLAVCLHLHFDFYDQFDKFLTTIFEARFSEFFLARINCLRELLVHNFSLSRATRQSCEEYATKVKVLISAADELMEKFPHHMKLEYRLFGEFAATEILEDKQLISVHYFAPMMLSRIAGCQRDVLTEASERFGLKSLTKEDVDLAKSKCYIPKYPDYEEHLRRSAEQLGLQDHQEFWPTIKTLFTKCVFSGVQYGVKDKYEKYLISSLLMIGPPALELLDLELQVTHHLTLESALLDIFSKLRNKKHQLLLIEHLLSSSVLEMMDLRKKLWAALFQMYKEKVLSVEIVFSNNMIITGLQDSNQLITTKEVTEIFKSCVGSLKSKNRKLINNCLKIFGSIMSHYPMNTIEWILNMQVPNCFSDEMPAENPLSAKILRGGEFLNLVFQRFLEHKYSKYNMLALSCLTNILKRHESSPSDPISGELVRIATCSQAGTLLDKFCTSESLKFISLTIGYFLKDVCRGVLSQPQLQELSLHCWTHVVCQEGQKDFSYLEHQGWQEIRYRAWLLLIKIQNSLCTTSETLQAFIHSRSE